MRGKEISNVIRSGSVRAVSTSSCSDVSVAKKIDSSEKKSVTINTAAQIDTAAPDKVFTLTSSNNLGSGLCRRKDM